MIRTFTAAALVLFTASAAWSVEDAPVSASTPAKIEPLPKPAKHFVYSPKASDLLTGKEDASVTIVEYASLSCPHCSHFYLHALPELQEKYIDSGKVKLVYRHYPLNDPALKAAELVQCAPPDKRHAYVKVLFSTQMKWAYDTSYRDALSNIAVLGGMDRLKFEHCMNDKSVERSVLDVAKEAQDDYHVDSTPTFYINDVEYKGDRDFPAMSKVIDTELAKHAKQ